MKHYSNDTLKIFNNVQHSFALKDKYNFLGSAGDLSVGEYVNLYFDVELAPNDILSSKIIKGRFSAIGSVMLIASAEKFCSIIANNTIAEVLAKCDIEKFNINIVAGKEYSFNFVLQAFYNIVESISNYGCATV